MDIIENIEQSNNILIYNGSSIAKSGYNDTINM